MQAFRSASRLSLLFLLALPLLSQGVPESGVAHELAQTRAARLADLRYKLRFTLQAKAAAMAGSETLTFTDSGAGDLPVDFRDGQLESAILNGHALDPKLLNGHLILPAAALVRGANTLVTSFTANTAAAGKAITRYTDKDDGSEYLYTLFVPQDADMAFPCFDQPDLKGRFTLEVSHPAEWMVIGNTAGMQDKPTFTSFPETRPISTYLFAFAAGPFERIAPPAAGEPAIYVRRSQLARAKTEAPEVQAITLSGTRFLEEFFQQPFPFPKYDLVLIPGFPFGGMEHAGATFLNEDGVLFRSTPTASDYFRRDVLVLHETTHQWFGDLVTMRWFDDLWLKEGFAQYMAYKAMAALKPETLPWKHFNEDIKPLAYGIDETEGTTPIFQNIPNLKDAKSAYGAIVYQKAPAVLKQLDYKLGNDVFRSGLRLYLKQHAYANATWPDLVGAFTQAGGKDVQSWADAWITRRGMPEIDTSFACGDGKITSLTLRQHDILPDEYVWPISNAVLLGYPQSESVVGVEWNTPSTSVAGALGQACPAFVFANRGDQAYGRFLLDPVSQPAVTRALSKLAEPFSATLTQSPGFSVTVLDPLARTQLYTALWENVRQSKASPRSYVELALQTLPNESDESLSRIQGGRISTALHIYLGTQGRESLTPRAETLFADRMLHAKDLGLRITAFRTFTSVAHTPAALGQLKQVLAGTLSIPGLPLKPLDRWNIITHLLAESDPEAPKLLADEQAAHHTGEDQKYAFAAQAAIPSAETKARYFADYRDTKVQEDWLTQSLGSFNGYNQQALTLPYLAQALDLLPEIKRTRKIFFLGAWLGSFLGGQSTPEAQAVVRQFLARKDLDPDLRLKVQAADNLDRTVKIRRTFPE